MSTNDTEMSFLAHLEIFRWHLIRSALAVLFFAIIAFIFKDIVFDVILLGPMLPTFPTYKVLCFISKSLSIGDVFCFTESPFILMNISMSGQFAAHITTSFFAGFIIAFPYVFWEFWCFVRPALHANEITMARGIVFYSSALFLLGVNARFRLLLISLLFLVVSFVNGFNSLYLLLFFLLSVYAGIVMLPKQQRASN